MKQEERAELETLGPDNVRMMLAANSRGTGRGDQCQASSFTVAK